MHIRLEQQGKTLRAKDQQQLFMAARVAQLPLMSIGEPPDAAAYDFHFGRELDVVEQAQFENLFRNYDPSTADNFEAAFIANQAARKAELRPLKMVERTLNDIDADLAILPAMTALQTKNILERVLLREKIMVRALSRLIERENTEDEE